MNNKPSYGFVYVFLMADDAFDLNIMPLIKPSDIIEHRDNIKCVLLDSSDHLTVKTGASFVVELWTGELIKARMPKDDGTLMVNAKDLIESSWMKGLNFDCLHVFGAFKYQAQALLKQMAQRATDTKIALQRHGFLVHPVELLPGHIPAEPAAMRYYLKVMGEYIARLETQLNAVSKANQREALFDLGAVVRTAIEKGGYREEK